MLQCTIVGLHSNFDFERNETSTTISLRFPSGETVQAAVTDAVAERVVAEQVQAKGAPSSVQASMEWQTANFSEGGVPPVLETPLDDDAPFIFGGTDATPEEAPAEVAAQAPVLPVPVNGSHPAPNRFVDEKGRIIVPSRTVPKNSAGYPVVPLVEQERSILEQDDDGIQQA